MNTLITKQPRRIMIFGRPGNGKSTLAVYLHKKLGIPLYHLDAYFYIDNWVERNYQEFLTIQLDLVTQSTWIIDGNCIRSLDMRWEFADLVIYLNYPWWKCYYRVFKRHFSKKNPDIKDRAANCKEKLFDTKFLYYMWHFEKRVERSIAYLRETYPQATFVEISNDQELKQLKQELIR